MMLNWSKLTSLAQKKKQQHELSEDNTARRKGRSNMKTIKSDIDLGRRSN